MYKRLIYISRAVSSVQLRDVYDIIRVANNRNSSSGLTGGLLFLDGYFIQLLEGAPHSIAERYDRILQDKRHFDIEIRFEETSNELLFPNEWMAVRDISQIDPAILRSYDYEPGLPKLAFNGDRIADFLRACFATEAVYS